MSKGSQLSFTAGELTPALHRRADLDKYIKGLKTCRNAFVHPHGGVSNRAGTQFIEEVKSSTKLTRVIEFSFNITDTYALEFGDQYLRVVRESAIVLLTVSPAVAWVTSTVYAVADHTSNGGDNYYCKSAHTSAAASEPGVGGSWTTYWYLLTDDTVEIPTVYTEDEIFEVKFVQSADIITMCHPNHPPAELSRYAHDRWVFTDISFAPTIVAPTGVSCTGGSGSSFNYVVTSISEETAEESVASALAAGLEDGCVISWTAVPEAESYAIYKEKNGVYGFIGVAQGTSFTEEKFIPEYNDTPPLERTPFDSAGNYPSNVTYHEQRLIFSKTINAPQKLWMSQTGNFHNFNVSAPTKADDAITLRIDAAQVNAVQNLVSLDDLLVLTSGAVHKITSGDNVFSFENLRTKPQSYRGSSALEAIVIDNTILFVQARGSSIRDIAYALEQDGYKGQQLDILSQHLVENHTIVDWTFAQEPNSLLWAIRDDGVLLGLTYMKEQEVLAWHKHDTDGFFESVCTVSEGQQDAVYFIVRREINGVTKRYIERLHTRAFTTIEDAFFVDSGLSYNGPQAIVTGATQANPVVITAVAHGFANSEDIAHADLLGMTELNGNIYTVGNVTADTYELTGIDGTGFNAYTSGGTAKKVVTVLSGLTHLENKDVAILADGNVHPTKTVVSGAVTLNYAANTIHIGLPYVTDIETLEPPFEGSAGSPIQASELIISVLNSRGLFAGFDEGNLTELKQRSDERWGEPTDLFTGYINMTIPSTWSNHGQILLRQVDPLPITILSIVPDYHVGS